MGIVALLAVVFAVTDPDGLVSFEADQPSSRLTASAPDRIRIDGDTSTHGSRSLRFDWRAGDHLRLDVPVPYADRPENPAGSAMTSVFGVSVRSSEPDPEAELVFEFGRGDTVDCRFELPLGFTGWRTVWVPFSDMEGAAREGMDFMRIVAPPRGAGVLHLDRIVPSAAVDARLPSPDAQVPFVRGGRPGLGSPDPTAWNRPVPEPDTEATDELREALRTVEARLEERYLRGRLLPRNALEEIHRRVREWAIVRDDDGVRGRPVHGTIHGAVLPAPEREAAERELARTSLASYGALMLDVARAYREGARFADPVRLGEIFVDLLRHLLDQGYAAGSAQGTVLALFDGEPDLFAALFLMRDALAREGLADEAAGLMAWYADLGRCRSAPEPQDADPHALAARTFPRLLAVLVPEGEATRIAGLALLRDWISEVLGNPAPGTLPGFKSDGTVFLRGGHDPGGARGSFERTAALLRLVGGTPFALDEAAHRSVRRVLLASRLYSDPEWGLGICGREPFDARGASPGIRGLETAFVDLALAGDPAGEERVDRRVAEAALRLWPDASDAFRSSTDGQPFLPEPEPSGHTPFPRGCFSIHRHEGRMVTIRGFSRYVWATETAPDANRFGRYLAHGSVQIFRPGGAQQSGIVQPGWDWNRMPGATVIHLPLDLLESPVPDVDRFRSNARFAGGVHLEGEAGVFAVTLAEPDRKRFDGTFRARKSVFCFEDRLVCLGTGIRNETREFPTETVLFQHALRLRSIPVWMDGPAPIDRFPVERIADPERAHWIVDGVGNGYHVAVGSEVRLVRKAQVSRRNDSGEWTRGDFASAWIDHGTAPDDAGYEYAIVLGTDAAAMEAFHRAMSDEATAPYRVLRRDDAAHVVHDRATRTTGFALYEAEAVGLDGVRAVSRPCLLLLRRDDQGLVIAACDPDLGYPGSPPRFEEDGPAVALTVEIDGAWSPAEDTSEEDVRVARRRGGTAISFRCRDGRSVPARLLPR